ncbi:M23 family metallopeptidase [Leucobacter sp. NPDC077196]|uniref:M23 family metallopeptidase n=1 Tax=Leucobacter sp. NPDC077196 TaxID=3154959 RepID=UPI0034127FD2
MAASVLLGVLLEHSAGATGAVLRGAGLPLMLFGYLLVAFGPRLIPQREAMPVVAPVTGRWLGMNSPATKVPSHGVRMYGQAHAIDLVAEPANPAAGVRPAFGDGPAMRANADYPAFGKPVRAMMSGTVVRASGWRRDHRARSTTTAVIYMMFEGAVREVGGAGFIIGNHVTIRGAHGTYALVAHLQRGSLMVSVGDTVQAGDVIARCGNSGNSSEPHVHAQLMDRASPLRAIGVPMAFSGIALDDDPRPTDGLPANDQHMTVPDRAAVH